MMSMSDQQRTYAIIGAARSGLAAAALLRSEGARVLVSDAKPAEASGSAIAALDAVGADYEFGGHTDRVLDADVLVLSPGVPDTLPIVRRAAERGIQIVSEIEIAWLRCAAPVVAITGTNGKTTTTELTGEIFRRSGRRTLVAGNVGIAFSEIAPGADAESVVVLEVSSFQLEHIARFAPRVAMVLNITPDHLDRYPSFGDYAEAKLRITMNQEAGDTLVYNGDDPELAGLPARSRARLLAFGAVGEPAAGAFVHDGALHLRIDPEGAAERVIDVAEIRIRGPHNLANAMAAALGARSLGVPVEIIAEALREFPGVPHRLEPVREVDGVRWVNDSKATNVDSLRYALSSFTEPIVLIAGGRSKKNVYDAILPLLARNVKGVVLVGEAAGEMEAAFDDVVPTRRAGMDMGRAVEIARSLAVPGDVVLLSPACASFDMFDNYEHRGDVFKQLVNELSPKENEQIELR